nr:hypothetical protein BaRGS_027216 [Batillaria attramentaria]
MGIAMGGAAVGILVGYPYGGFMYTFVGKAAPFLIISVLTLLNLGAVMLTTMSMAVLEPTLPLWVMSTMHVQKWQLGLVFLPDSVGYLIGTNCFGLVALRVGSCRLQLKSHNSSCLTLVWDLASASLE